MRFVAIRTSNHSYTVQPCEEAVESEECVHWDGKHMWEVEIRGLRELMRFVNRHGEIVIRPPMREPRYPDEKLPRLEIYDTWRE